MWSRTDALGMDHEEVDGDIVSMASAGIGAAINCRLSMINMEGSWNEIDNGGLHRYCNPGAGAISPYHDRQGIATEDIQAGEELFISYGEIYFKIRMSTYGNIPLLNDFNKADVLLKSIIHCFRTMKLLCKYDKDYSI